MRLSLPALFSIAFFVVSPSLAAEAQGDYVMMKVNGDNVTKAEIEQMWQGLFPPGSAPAFDQVKPEMRDKLLRGIMTEKLLLDEAEKKGLDTSEEVERQLEMARRKLAVKAFLEQKTGDVSDAELKRTYDEYVKSIRDEKEVRARHILVPSEKEANEVKAKLAEGKSFEEVARDFSKDPGSAHQGGDLGYFTRDKMVKPFADAAFKMKKGEVSEPVKSDFGWHVIKVEDVRKVTVPTYNEAKDTLRAKLQDKKLADFIDGLVKKADVTVYDAAGKEIKFDKHVN